MNSSAISSLTSSRVRTLHRSPSLHTDTILPPATPVWIRWTTDEGFLGLIEQRLNIHACSSLQEYC